MTEPRIEMQVNLLDGVILRDGTAERCPLCGAAGPLSMLMVSDDWSTDPVQLSCPWGHAWPSRGLEAWQLAHLIVEVRVAHPELLGMVAEMVARQEVDREGGLP